MIRAIFIVILLCGIIVVSRSWYLFKNERTTIKNTLFWTLLWIIIGIGILIPKSLDFAMKILKMENRLFFISLIGLLVLLIVVYNLSISQKKSERTISKLIQEIAILSYKLDQNINPKEQDDEKQRIHLDY